MKGWQGLCLALISLTVGCIAPPRAVISPDTKFVAYGNSNSLVIRETLSGKVMQKYSTGEVYSLTWSPKGSKLIWSNFPIDTTPAHTRVLDLSTGIITLLPIPFMGPFKWTPDESAVTGFEIPPTKNPDEKKKPNGKLSKYDFASKSLTSGEVFGNYLPLEFFPNSQDLLVLGEHGVFIRDAKARLTELQALDEQNSWEPASYTLTSNQSVILSLTKFDARGMQNRVAVTNAKGNLRYLQLPKSVANSRLSRSGVERVLGASPDQRWLFVGRFEDRSKGRDILAAVLKRKMETPNKVTKASKTLERLKPDDIRIAVRICRFDGSSSHSVGSFASSDVNTLAETHWSQGGEFATLGLALGNKRCVWLVDLRSFSSKVLLQGS